MVLGIISIYKLKLPGVNEAEHFLAKGLFMLQERNIGNSHLKYFSTMEKKNYRKLTDRPFFLAIPPSKWEFFLSGRYQAEP